MSIPELTVPQKKALFTICALTEYVESGVDMHQLYIRYGVMGTTVHALQKRGLVTVTMYRIVGAPENRWVPERPRFVDATLNGRSVADAIGYDRCVICDRHNAIIGDINRMML